MNLRQLITTAYQEVHQGARSYLLSLSLSSLRHDLLSLHFMCQHPFLALTHLPACIGFINKDWHEILRTTKMKADDFYPQVGLMRR